MGPVSVWKYVDWPQNGATSEYYSVLSWPHFGAHIQYVAREGDKINGILSVPFIDDWPYFGPHKYHRRSETNA